MLRHGETRAVLICNLNARCHRILHFKIVLIIKYFFKKWNTFPSNKVKLILQLLFYFTYFTTNATSCVGTGYWLVDINCVLQNLPMNVILILERLG